MSDEFELVPSKKLKELETELNKVKNSNKKQPASSKEYTNILNAFAKIENKFEFTVKTLNKLTNKLDKILKIFSSDVEEEGSEVDQLGEILARLEKLENSNESLRQETKNLHSSITRKSYFDERLPRGLKIKYRRTKNL